MVYVIDALLLFLFFLCVKNFRAGYVGCLLFRLLFPWYVMFKVGSFQASSTYFLMFFLLIAWLFNKEHKKSVCPKFFFNLFLFYIIYTLVLIFLSSAVAPYGYQLKAVVIRILLGDIGWFVFGAYAFREGSHFCYKCLNVFLIAIGLYGIIAYLFNMNVWTTFLSLLYNVEMKYEFFLSEVRGGLLGRTSGTFEHPLAWGQFWVIVFSYCLLKKKNLSKKNFVFLVILALANVYFSGSRAAFLASVVAFIFWALNQKFAKMVKMGFWGFAVVLCVIPLLSSGTLNYLESTLFFWDESSQKTHISGSSTDMRYDQFAAAYEISMDNPIGGMGYDLQNYSEGLSGRFRRLIGFESVAIKVLVEQGFVGLFCFFIFYLSICFYFIKKSLREHRLLVVGYCVSFLLSALFTGIQGFSLLIFMLLLWIDWCDERRNGNAIDLEKEPKIASVTL